VAFGIDDTAFLAFVTAHVAIPGAVFTSVQIHKLCALAGTMLPVVKEVAIYEPALILGLVKLARESQNRRKKVPDVDSQSTTNVSTIASC
jgi:hypothetical protein